MSNWPYDPDAPLTDAPPTDPAAVAVRAQGGALERDLARELALRRILVGVFAIAVGGLITFVTYESARASGGGRYMVAWGPMAWGVFEICRGALGRG